MRPEAAKHQRHLNLGPRFLVSVTSLNKRAGLSDFPPWGLLLAFLVEAGSQDQQGLSTGRWAVAGPSLCPAACVDFNAGCYLEPLTRDCLSLQGLCWALSCGRLLGQLLNNNYNNNKNNNIMIMTTIQVSENVKINLGINLLL